jgi:hypothetical protein
MLAAMRGLRAIVTVGLAAAFAPLAVALSTKASADGPSTARLSWVRVQGAESCIDRDTLAKDVSTRLGRDAFGGTPTRSIEGIVARDGAKWTARLYVRDLAGALIGDREIASDAADCKALSSAVTLAIALVIDPEAAFAPPPSTSASPAASPSPSPIVLTSASLSAVPRSSPSGVVTTIIESPIVPAPRPVLMEARFGVTTGLVPKVAPAAMIGFEGTTTIHPRVLALFVPATRTDDGTAGFGITAANAGACGSFASDDNVLLSACVGAVVGVIHSYVYGLQPVTPGDRPWFAASTGLDGALRIAGPVRLVFAVEALWPITRHRFLAEGRTEPLFRQPFVTMLASIGAGIAFP